MHTRALRPALVHACAAALLTIGCGRSQPSPPASRPNILLVTIDTLRADRIGAGVAPGLDRLAASSVRFTSARTAAPLTLPAHTTLHTGLLPPEHGVRENGAGALAASHRTIATLLKASGYQTAAFVGAFVLDRRFGLAQGFDTYDDQIPRDPQATERLEAERPARAVVDRALAWFNQHSTTTTQQTPFFLWVHLYDPHAPYEPPPEFAARAKTPYDGEVAYADAELARLFTTLRTAGVLDRTLVVVAADHGEGLGDHGERTHGMLVYDSTLRVPLVFSVPGRAPETSDETVSLSEVAPTILRAAGVTPPPEMKGRDLLTVRLKPNTTYDVYAETEYPHVAGWAPLQALTDGRWKTIRAGAATEVYDVRVDPREEHDVAATQASVAQAMSARAGTIHGAAAAPAAALSPDAQERLRALGYVASSASTAPSTSARNPARSIAAWNEFEDALGMLAAKRPQAVDVLKALALKNPDAPVMHTTYAHALRDVGRAAEALVAYRAAARKWPTDPALLHDLATAARDAAAAAPSAGARTLREEAARADRAAIELQPGSATAHNGLGLLAVDQGRPGDAVPSFERAASLDPNNASYWANLGNARRASGYRAGAEQAYRRALDVDARSVDAANGLGVLLVEANRPGEAVSWFQRAIDAAPNMMEARLNLGIALQSAGRADRAAEQYRLVLSARGQHAREKEAAAKLLAELGASR